MRKISIDASSGLLDDVLAQAREDRVLLKRDGRPVALVINVEDKDEERIELENDPKFWRMIEKARNEPTIPFAQVKTKLEADERAGRGSQGTKPKRTKPHQKD